MIPLLTPVHRWECPNCKFTDITHEAKPHIRYHPCVGLRGLIAPMVRAGEKVKVEAVERGDYIGNELAGRYMAVRTERQDGSNDTAVFAPTAHLKVE